MRTIVTDIAQLTDAHRAAIEAAARAHGFEARFFDSEADALADAAGAEILFTGSLALVGAAKALKWLCVPSAGAENYLKPVLEDRSGVRLSRLWQGLCCRCFAPAVLRWAVIMFMPDG